MRTSVYSVSDRPPQTPFSAVLLFTVCGSVLCSTAEVSAACLCYITKVDIGYGVCVPGVKLVMVRSQRPTQLVRQLMELVFTRSEMAGSSVTGRTSNKTSGPAKPALDQTKVAAILCELSYIMETFI